MDFIQPCQDVLAIHCKQPLAAWHHGRLWGFLKFYWQYPRSIEEVHTMCGVPGQTLEPLLTVVLAQLFYDPGGTVAKATFAQQPNDPHITGIP